MELRISFGQRSVECELAVGKLAYAIAKAHAKAADATGLKIASLSGAKKRAKAPVF